MIDILLKIIEEELTVDQAYDIIDDIVDKFNKGEVKEDINISLGLDKFEWTAICHALDLDILAAWRRYGWPQKCSVCGSSIDYRKYGWTIKDNNLKCIDCF